MEYWGEGMKRKIVVYVKSVSSLIFCWYLLIKDWFGCHLSWGIWDLASDVAWCTTDGTPKETKHLLRVKLPSPVAPVGLRLFWNVAELLASSISTQVFKKWLGFVLKSFTELSSYSGKNNMSFQSTRNMKLM